MDIRLKKGKLLGILFFIFLLISGIITTIDMCCFDRGFYSKEYAKSNTASIIDTSLENLEKMTDVILDYLKDPNKTMDLKLMVKGEVQEVFSERAKLHMVDVRNLYLKAIDIRNISLVLSFLLLVIIFIVKVDIKTLIYSYKRVVIGLGLLFSSIGLFALIDFNTFWVNFHKVFFSNDLWLLEYNDVLVNMVNETFFFDLVLKIVAIILIGLLLIYFLLKLLKEVKKNEN